MSVNRDIRRRGAASWRVSVKAAVLPLLLAHIDVFSPVQSCRHQFVNSSTANGRGTSRKTWLLKPYNSSYSSMANSRACSCNLMCRTRWYGGGRLMGSTLLPRLTLCSLKVPYADTFECWYGVVWCSSEMSNLLVACHVREMPHCRLPYEERMASQCRVRAMPQWARLWNKVLRTAGLPLSLVPSPNTACLQIGSWRPRCHSRRQSRNNGQA
jgi:hypothetical protein